MNNAAAVTPPPSAEPDVLGELAAADPESAPPEPPARKRRWPWLVAAGALALGAAGTVWAVRGGGTAAPTVETAKVDRGRITVQVTASGTVSALKTVLVGSQVSGRVAELFVDFNDTVKKDQLLARLDTQLFKSAVGQARASLAIARANVSKAEAQLADAQRALSRGKILGAQKFLAQEQVDEAASAVDVARAALLASRAQAQQAAAQVEQAELNLAMTAIHSPIDGVVISRSVDVGQTVAASLQAPTVFTLAEDLRKMQVEAHVAEGDVAKLSPGMAVSFTVDAFPGRKFSGALRQVRNAAETVQNVVTYDAIVDVDNPQLELRPGMTANVSFVVADKENVVRIPNAALRFRPPRQGVGLPAGQAGSAGPRGTQRQGEPRDASQKVVFAPGATPGALRPVRVKTGITDGSHTELVTGELDAGAELVTDLGGTPAPKSNAPAAGLPGMGTPGMGGPGMGAGSGRRSGRL